MRRVLLVLPLVVGVLAGCGISPSPVRSVDVGRAPSGSWPPPRPVRQARPRRRQRTVTGSPSRPRRHRSLRPGTPDSTCSSRRSRRCCSRPAHTSTIGYNPVDCCHAGGYNPEPNDVWVSEGALASTDRLTYVTVHELAHSVHLRTGRAACAHGRSRRRTRRARRALGRLGEGRRLRRMGAVPGRDRGERHHLLELSRTVAQPDSRCASLSGSGSRFPISGDTSCGIAAAWPSSAKGSGWTSISVGASAQHMERTRTRRDQGLNERLFATCDAKSRGTLTIHDYGGVTPSVGHGSSTTSTFAVPSPYSSRLRGPA